jgi:hypothetical protein
MTDRSSWLFPVLDLRSYIKRYPLVFIFSLATAFSTLLNTVAHIFLFQYLDNPILGFDSIVRCLGVAVPLYGLLHLSQESSKLKKIRLPLVFYTLGLVLLFLLMQYFLSHSSLDLSPLIAQLYLFFLFAALSLPILENEGDPQRQWAYCSSLVLSGGGALLMTWLASFFFHLIISHIPIPYFSYFLSEDNYGTVYGDNNILFLVLPWYLMGTLSQYIKEKGESTEAALPVGPFLLYSFMLLALLGFFIGWITMAYGAVTQKLIDSDYAYGLTFILLFGYFSIFLLNPVQTRKTEKWMDDYRRYISIAALPLIFFTFLILKSSAIFGRWEDFAFVYVLLALAWLYLWSLIKPRTGLAIPTLGLLILIAFSLAGPLSLRELSFNHYRGDLARLFQAAGMFQNGKLVKPAAGLETQPYNDLQTDLTTVGSQFGITRLQDWFSLDLKAFENNTDQDQEGLWQNAPLILQTLGVTQCDVLIGNESKHFGTRMYNNPLDIKGYDQEQHINLSTSCPVPSLQNRDEYLVSFTDKNQFMTVQYQGQFLADIPLQKIEQVIKTYDYRNMVQMNIPVQDLSVEYENDKVKAKVYFQTIDAFKQGDEYRLSNGYGTLLISRK